MAQSIWWKKVCSHTSGHIIIIIMITGATREYSFGLFSPEISAIICPLHLIDFECVNQKKSSGKKNPKLSKKKATNPPKKWTQNVCVSTKNSHNKSNLKLFGPVNQDYTILSSMVFSQADHNLIPYMIPLLCTICLSLFSPLINCIFT